MCSVSSRWQKKDLLFSWKSQPKLRGVRTAGSARADQVLLDPSSPSSCHSFRSGSSLLGVSRIPLRVSGRAYALTAQPDTAHTPAFWGGQTEARFAPRMRPHCSCFRSWRSGSSGLRGQMQLLVNCAKPCAFTRKVCVVVGRVGCVSWIASKIVFCFNRPEWLMILTFALIAV